MANQAVVRTAYVTVDFKVATDHILHAADAVNAGRRVLLHFADDVPEARSGTGTLPRLTIGTNSPDFNNVFGLDEGAHAFGSGDLNVAEAITENVGYRTFGQLVSGMGLRVKIVLASTYTTHSGVILVTYSLI